MEEGETDSLLDKRSHSPVNFPAYANCSPQRTGPGANNFNSPLEQGPSRPTTSQAFELPQRTQDFWGKPAVMQSNSLHAGVIHGGNTPLASQVINKTFIQRDYSEGTAVKFQEKLPEELNGKVSYMY